MIFVKTANHVPLECISRIIGEIGSDNCFFDSCSTSDGTNQPFPEMWRKISDLDFRFTRGSLGLDHVRVNPSVAPFADVTHNAVNTNFVHVR